MKTAIFAAILLAISPATNGAGACRAAAQSPASEKLAAVNVPKTTPEKIIPGKGRITAVAAPRIGVKPGDWPQWGGSSIRNNTPDAKNIPSEWNPGGFDPKTGKWLKDQAKNIKWVAQLGSQSYGNPVVANGKIYVGSNNGGGHLKRYPSAIDLGVLLCFNEADGKFLWQHSNEKLPTGRVHDWPLQGICCAPLVEGNRLWYVTSRGEVVCLDTEGFLDGEDDGPVVNEPGRLFDIVKSEDPAKDKLPAMLESLKAGKISVEMAEQFKNAGLTLPDKIDVVPDGQGFKFSFTPSSGAERAVQMRMEGPQRLAVYKILNTDDKDEADVVWRLNMMKQLGISQHNMCSCSVTAAGDILFVNTSNGVDEGHVNLPAPSAPTLVALDKRTGKVLWSDNSPGTNVLHGQWSSPSFAVIDGVPQVIFGAGDGWLYSFLGAETKDGKAELLWKFDCNPKESKYVLGGRADRNHIIGTPLIYDGLVYVGVGEDPEHGEGVGHFWCIDPRMRGDVSPELAFSLKDLEHPIPHRRNQAVIKEQGEVARPNPNSAAVWHFAGLDANGNNKLEFEETMHRTCGTAAIKDGLLFIADFSGLLHCLDLKTGKPHWAYDMLAACWGSPLIIDGKVYIGDEDGDVTVFALSAKQQQLAEMNMGSAVYSTPIVANGVLYIASKDHLFAIEAPEK